MIKNTIEADGVRIYIWYDHGDCETKTITDYPTRKVGDRKFILDHNVFQPIVLPMEAEVKLIQEPSCFTKEGAMSYKSEILELFENDNWECEDYYPLIHTLRDLPTIELRRAYMDKFVAEIEKDTLLIKNTHSKGESHRTTILDASTVPNVKI